MEKAPTAPRFERLTPPTDTEQAKTTATANTTTTTAHSTTTATDERATPNAEEPTAPTWKVAGMELKRTTWLLLAAGVAVLTVLSIVLARKKRM